MNRAENFLKKSIAAVVFLFILLCLVYLFSFISQNIFYSVSLAGGLASLNFLIGIASVKIGLKASQETFFKAVLGGMSVRLLIMLSLVFISLKFLNINLNSFIFSILFFYILYLVIEVIYLYMKKL